MRVEFIAPSILPNDYVTAEFPITNKRRNPL